MKKVLLPACIIAITFFTGCIGDPPKHEETSTVTDPMIMPSAPSNGTPSKSVFGAAPTTTSGQQMFPASAQPTNAATAGLNPAHGQPNHRCDIAVGAPLNSPATQVQQTSPAAQPVPAATLPVAPQPNRVAASTATGLNPAHGQPNHRCDIAVGAPLNSPANQQVQQPMPATQSMPAATLPAYNGSGSVKLNPAHGQPGHDCAVAVGAPLKS